MIGDALTKGEETQPLLDLTIGELLMRAVEERGNNIALIVAHQNIRWSYSEVANAVDELAGSLLSLGLKKGDRVALCSPNRYEWIVTQLATARVGLILVCINPAYRLHPPSPRRERPLRQALLDAGAVRFKPIMLTAAAAMIGAAFIITDPIFQGLAISLVFGLASSTALTVLVIPAVYVWLRDDGQGFGTGRAGG